MAVSNPNIFGREAGSIDKAFSADSVKLKFGDTGPNGDGHNLVVQSLQVSYTQQVSKIYDISASNGADAYYVAGRAEGRAQLQKIIGPSTELCRFYKKYGDVCEIAGSAENNIVLTGEFGCGDDNAHKTDIVLIKPVVVSFGMAVNANDVLITEDTQMIFHSLTFGAGCTSV